MTPSTRHAAPANRDLRLAWYQDNFAAPDSIALSSDDFGEGQPIPVAHAATRVGGANQSPALAWSTPPSATSQLLLLIEDPDAPTRLPYVHCLALLDPALSHLDRGALTEVTEHAGVILLRNEAGPGYLGPAPPKSHGPHRYVFELFALPEPLNNPNIRTMHPRDVLSQIETVMARGRIDGTYKSG